MNPQAGWYPDSTGRQRSRYWDGQHWTTWVNEFHAQDPLPADETLAPPDPESLQRAASSASPADGPDRTEAQSHPAGWKREEAREKSTRGIAIAIVITVLLLLGGCGYLYVVEVVSNLPVNDSQLHKEYVADKRKGQERADAVLSYLRDDFGGEPWSAYLGDAAEAKWEVGVISIITEMSEIPAKRTPEEDAYAIRICDAAVTYRHGTFDSEYAPRYAVAVLANDALTQLATCSPSSRAVAPTPASTSVPTTALPVVEDEAGRALSAYLRANFADAPWLAEYDAVEQAAPEVIIRTTMSRWKLSGTEMKLADAMCEAAATAPGVERVEIRRTDDSRIVYCAARSSSPPATKP